MCDCVCVCETKDESGRASLLCLERQPLTQMAVRLRGMDDEEMMTAVRAAIGGRKEREVAHLGGLFFKASTFFLLVLFITISASFFHCALSISSLHWCFPCLLDPRSPH